MNRTESSEVEPAALLEMLANSDSTIRESARESLVAMGKPAVAPLAIALQTSMSDQVRWEAAKALGSLVDVNSLPALVQALEDSESDVAWLAGEALRQFKRRAWPALLRALIESRGRSGSLRQGAHQVFTHQEQDGFTDAIEALLKTLQPEAVPDSTVIAANNLLLQLTRKDNT